MTIRVVTDPDELVELYSRDPHLHIYALADLEEPYWSQSTWWRDGDAVVGPVGLRGGGQVVYAVSSADPAGTLKLVETIQAQIGPGLVTGVKGIAQVFAAAGLATLLGIGAGLGPGEEGDIERAIRRGTTDTINEAGQRAVDRSLGVQPSITVRPGWPVNVIVTRDLVLRPTGA